MSKLQPYGRRRADSKREIQRILDSKGKNFVDVAVVAGVTRQTVSATMNGYRHSPRVLNALRTLGVPERLLFDPRRTENAA
ncbi:XRE family transcriptional regulator [Desulfovibrio piger]|jgi:transcriptional regulator with XRE-family HTH domain|uniref:XRE family transcriptional regulator n=1 Tax=Desulfovibrio piger TaxID=901 RepID=UPI0026EC0D14|nr:XRE family transcriptional regulator [Desulfovibrio piger]MDD6247795.1 XRE family transcriptional regulator [Desulfovibrio piger]